ncbi:MAG: TRAP transporter fused permease subunit [Thermoprotei archaeon]|nr:TRAP transporter fused permease subunit [Thermoprotei archaeon]
MYLRGRLKSLLLIFLGFIFAFYELFYIMKFNFFLYSILSRVGFDVRFLLNIPDIQLSMALLLSIIIIVTIVSKPSRFLGKLSILYDVTVCISGVVGFLFLFYVYEDVIKYGYLIPTPERLIMPLLALFALLDAARRVLGFSLPVIALGAILLAFYLEGFNVRMIVNHFYYAKEGIFSIPLFVMVSYVFAFIFFGSLLKSLGVGGYITEFLLALLGPRVKGVAKLAVASSMLMGTISGSSVANVMVTGTYTIPLSKRAGYPAHIAGAAEASASTGGQIMPPILGAAAFIMAEFLGRPYRDIMIAATIPAILYFFSVYMFLDRISKRYGLTTVRREDLPPLAPALKRVYLLTPIPLIAVLLLWGLEPQYAAIGSLGAVILLTWLGDNTIPLLFKVLMGAAMALVLIIGFLAGFPLGAALFFLGVSSIMLALAIAFVARGVSGIFQSLINTFSGTLDGVSTVFLAAALAGIVQGSLTLTGLAATIGFRILDIAGGNIFLVAFLVMIISLILGMGVPTTANYVITATIGGAALAIAVHDWTGLPMGSSRLVAHFFVFYFGILADVTPPVALASYAASGLAKADFWRTALTASKLSLAGYLVPYIFLLNPTLLILTVEWHLETLALFALGFAGAALTIIGLSSGIEGWLGGNLGPGERVLLVMLALLNIVQNPLDLSATIATLTIIAYTLIYLRNSRKSVLRSS